MAGPRLLLMLLLVYSPYPALVVGRKVVRTAGLDLEERAADLPDCPVVKPTKVAPKQLHRVLPRQLSKDWEFDGVSPFMPVQALSEALDVEGTSMKIPLVGRGSADPLRKDPFGAGMRVSTRYAYLGGTLCATIRIPEPTNGTIFGMYLIDYHPKVSERGKSVWREADMEWLGRWPDRLQTVIWEKGAKLQVPHVNHNLKEILNGTVQQDPVRYCIQWDLSGSMSGPQNKTVRFTAKSPKHPTWAVMREWSPHTVQADEFWNEPLRGIFTTWSVSDKRDWAGPYSIPDGKMLWVDVQDIEFKPKGPAFCRKADLDL